MFMAAPSHVPPTLPADLSGAYAVEKQVRVEQPAYLCGPTAVDGLITWGVATGTIHSIRLAAADGATATPGAPPKRGGGNARGAKPGAPNHTDGPKWPLATVTPTSTPARYGGCLLVGSADYSLHAVSDQGVHLWSFMTGGRVYSSPLPNADDVYFGADDGRVYKVDLHSGMMLWEFTTGDRVRGSPAMAGGKIFVPSFDGFCYAIDAQSGRQVWKSPVAKFTRASPAVAADRIYLGDEAGQMHCLNAATGAPIWTKDLGGYVSACPLVTAEGIVFLSEQGDAAMLSPDGSVKWKRKLEARVKGQPIATRTQVLIPTSEGLAVIKRATGEADPNVSGVSAGQVIGVAAYRGKVGLVRSTITTNFDIPPRTYAVFNGAFELWGQSK
jgi:outer membrane protein assembly factor BamB